MKTVEAIDVRKEVLAAHKRIRPYVLETHVEHSIYFSELIKGTVHLKLDLYQTTGSFKFRGASSKIMPLLKPLQTYNKEPMVEMWPASPSMTIPLTTIFPIW